MHDVAPLIRVSQTTVSFVLHGREEADISDETKAPYSAATWLLSLSNLIRGTHHANASGRARPLTGESANLAASPACKATCVDQIVCLQRPTTA